MIVEDYIKKYGIVQFKQILTEKGKKRIKYPKWIITDVRFPNEAQAIVDRGGIMIRVNRFTGDVNKDVVHVSETAMENWAFDYVINNNSGINELIETVENVLNIINLKQSNE